MKEIIYLGVTPDELELPLVIAGNLQELSEITGLTKAALSSAIHFDKKSKKSGQKRGMRFRKLEIDS